MQQPSTSKQFTRGGQISVHNVLMLWQVYRLVLLLWIISLVLLSAGFTYRYTTSESWQAFVDYSRAKIIIASRFGTKKIDSQFQGKTYRLPPQTVITLPYIQQHVQHFNQTFKHALWQAFLLSSLFAIIAIIIFIRKGKHQSANTFIRGSKLASPNTVKRQLQKTKTQSDLTIDGFPLVKNSEVQHLLIHGTIGTGKSTLIRQLLTQLRARGDRVILYDKGCSFMRDFFDESIDVLLNPFDERCANWDLWCEAPKDADLDNMAESLIPLHGESDPFWVDAARTVFTSVASKMRHDQQRSIEHLLQALLTQDFSALETYLADTPAATLVTDKIEKTAVSIRAVITTYLKSLQTLNGLASEDKPPFSVRDYLIQSKQPGWLFIACNGEQHTTVKPLISMWLAMASITLLSLPEDAHRRIWFICDELPSLHKLPLLGATIAEVRKFGGCFVLGMQSKAQLEKVYGMSGARELLDCLNTRFYFRSPSSEMARFVANELGEEDIEETSEQTSYGANSIRDGVTVGKRQMKRTIVAYSEIMSLPNLTCYCRLPGDYPVTRLTLQYQDYPKRATAYLPRSLPVASSTAPPSPPSRAIDFIQ